MHPSVILYQFFGHPPTFRRKAGQIPPSVTDEWTDKHIRIEELGAHYLDAAFVMEDDTSSFLGLLPSGLNI
ncbi:hypothetical protein PM082_022171 [Marasmius tenuissimus]|nr:hypothetical protein PM082_022171 [Marasmius tenuissimus]